MKRRPFIMVVVFVVLAALVTWMTTTSAPDQLQQLADGSQLKLKAATYGKLHEFVHGNFWQGLLLNGVPKRFLNKQGPWEKFTHYSLQKIDGRLIAFAPESPSLVLWTVHHGAKQGWYQDNFIRAEVLDENGIECDTATFHHVDSGKGYDVVAWELTAFPRRGKRVGLRIYHQNGQWSQVAEFYVNNPAIGSHPIWQPESLPATRNDGDLAVTLSDLTVGDLKPPLRTMLGFGQTRLALSLAESGQPSAAWEPVSFLIEDATGNRRDDWQFIMNDDRNREIGRILPGMFNPAETWKLRIGVARKEGAEFREEELWTVRGAPFSEEGREGFFVSTNLQGVSLRLTRTTARFVGNSEHPVLELALSPPRDDVRVSLVEAAAEQGHAITNLGTAYNRKEGKFSFYEIGSNRTNPRIIDLTVAIHHIRYLSFLAKPSLAPTNQSLERK